MDGVPIKTKRWNDAAADGGGFRLLVCRVRPRGVAKAKEDLGRVVARSRAEPRLARRFPRQGRPAATLGRRRLGLRHVTVVTTEA
jgi:hypothetical protein